jgi:hypothetical protein
MQPIYYISFQLGNLVLSTYRHISDFQIVKDLLVLVSPNLSHLAVKQNVAASTQNQALSALPLLSN